jgi:hypothetical protein
MIRISGHGGSWSARLTPAGSTWLAEHPRVQDQGIGQEDVADLIRKVIAAGGCLRIPGDASVQARHQRLIEMSHG